jgi:hypothetical protein
VFDPSNGQSELADRSFAAGVFALPSLP